MPNLGASIPEIYASLLPPDLLQLSVEETRATCGECAMCRAPASEPGIRFLPSTKCCTFWPKLPNYLVGSLLAESSGRFAEGQTRILAQVEAGVGASTLGVGPTVEYLERLHAERPTSFGRSETLLCPYFERSSGACTIWAHRESDCSSFFCKFENARRFEFWRQFGALLALLEQKLSVYAQAEASRSVDFSTQPAAFYVATFEAIRKLTFADLPTLLGEPWVHRQREVRRAIAALSEPSRPEQVRLASGLQVQRNERDVSVISYNEYDALSFRAEEYAALESIGVESIPSADLEGALFSTRVNGSEPDLLQRLLDHEVLLPG